MEEGPQACRNPGVNFGRGFVTLDVESEAMNNTQTASSQQHPDEEEPQEGKAWAVVQAGLLLLALGLAAAGLWLPEADLNAPSVASVLIVTEDAGDACPLSGVVLSYGEDVNADGVLQSTEREGSMPVCDGTRGHTGSPGANGLSVLMSSASLPPGEMCPEGGVTYQWGLDLNASGVLDEEEVLDASHLCSGTDGSPGASGPQGQDGVNGSAGQDGKNGTSSLLVSALPDAGVCPVGLLLHIGVDDGPESLANDGVLQSEEIDETVRICATDLRAGPLSDLSTGIADSFSPSCDAMNHIGGALYAAMVDGIHGCELHLFDDGWQTPQLVTDLNPSGDAQPGLHLGLHEGGGGADLVFDATGANGHRDLWAFNKTSMVPERLTADASGSTVDGGSTLVPWLDGHVLTRPGGVGLPWWTDGTPSGTMALDLHPAFSGGDALRQWSAGVQRMGLDLVTVSEEGLWMEAENAAGDVEPALIHADGTVQTFEVWASGSSSPANGVPVDQGIVVVGTTTEGRQLIHLDPDQPPRQITHLVRSSGQSPAFVGTTFGLMPLDGGLVFDAVLDGADASLWRWDASTDEVLRLSTTMMNPGDDMGPVEHDGRLWFSCVTMASGAEPCSTDGTVNGTHVHEMVAGWSGSLPRAAVSFLDGVAVLADDGNGTALHHLTSEGHALLHDPLPTGDADAGRYGGLLLDEQRLVFVAHDGTSGHEIHGWCHGSLTQAWIIWP